MTKKYFRVGYKSTDLWLTDFKDRHHTIPRVWFRHCHFGNKVFFEEKNYSRFLSPYSKMFEFDKRMSLSKDIDSSKKQCSWTWSFLSKKANLKNHNITQQPPKWIHIVLKHWNKTYQIYFVFPSRVKCISIICIFF